ncbi:MAG: cytochrome c [Bacteroidota bacterium]|nr:cytochrome c [Bacteroidota bacterium]MDP4249991.1 cytochrome c [Bacteroidota bacterium]
MKKFLKLLGSVVLILILALIIIVVYIKVALPNVGPAPQIKVERTATNTARGEYLAKSVMVCMDCHSLRNASEYAMPMDVTTLGEGGQEFGKSEGFPGTFFSANITPAGIGSWTDGEIYRAITTGVRKSGKAIFPVMPYHNYGKADPEDIKAVIAYLRSIPAIEHSVPESKSDFPMNIILNTIPEKAVPGKIPADKSDTVAQGKYLFTIASCHDCHTPLEKGKFVENLAMAGGREFIMAGAVVRSANITPDKQTGIGSWTREMFLQRFAEYRDSARAHRVLSPGEPQTIMPWSMYATMKDQDLSNIYSYIQTIQPISHAVVKFQTRN